MIRSSYWLLRFYKEWLAWAEGPHKLHRSFGHFIGLCGSLDCWAREVGVAEKEAVLLGVQIRQEARMRGLENVSEEMLSQFDEAGLCLDYPFGGRAAFLQDFETKSMHQNEVRLQWVRDRIRDMGVDNG